MTFLSTDTGPTASLSWFGIIRLGLVQTALGAIVVLTTSTLNRVMVIEVGTAALVPGLLVALHYAVQMLRPRWGHGSDQGGRRTPWIIAGMAILAAGGAMAALATALMGEYFTIGLALGILAFLLIGVGVGAAGTSLLVLLADRAPPERKAAAATIVWLMMIAGFALTAITVGQLLDPYSPERLVGVVSAVSMIAFVVACLAVWGVEPARHVSGMSGEERRPSAFREALVEVWAEPRARRFTIFIFVSMLAYNTQDLILEPFAGIAFGMTPGQSTKLGGYQHGGVFVGMVMVAVLGTVFGRSKVAVLQGWIVGGCLASALFMAGLAVSASFGYEWPLVANVVLLGVANGAFAIAAIGAMMGMANTGSKGRAGMRMGLWGASQAIAFALGGVVGTLAVDVARRFVADPVQAYGIVFGLEAIMFLASAALAIIVSRDAANVQRENAARDLNSHSGFDATTAAR
jgi:BCD family chlorophyll transporter-like MFS transporter